MSVGAVIEGVSGGIGAVVALVTTYPLLTINTRQSTRSSEDGAENNESLYAALVKVCQEEDGLSSLFKGIEPALIGTVVSQGIYFYLYEELKQLAKSLRRPGRQAAAAELTVAESLVVASIAGCGNVLLTNPIWVATTRMQTASKSAARTNFVHELKSLWQEGGYAALWRGTIPSLIMVSNPTIQYVLYEWLTSVWSRRKQAAGQKAAFSSFEIFVTSAAAKLGATLVTYPVLLLKNRVQAAHRSSDGGMGKDTSAPANSVRIITSVLEKDGVLGLYAGLRTKIVQSVLAAALLFMLKARIRAGVEQSLGTIARLG